MLTSQRRLLMCSMTVPWPDRPTQGLYHIDQALALNDMGIKTTVFSPAPWVPAIAGQLCDRFDRHVRRPRAYEVNGIPIDSPRTAYAYPRMIRFGVAQWSPATVQGHATCALARPITNAIKRHRINGLLAHGCVPWGGVIRRVAARLGLPYAFIEHSAEDVLRLRARSRLAQAYRSAAAGAQAVYTVNQQMAGHLRHKIGCPNVVHLPNGVATQGLNRRMKPRPARLEGRKLVVAAGHYYRRKGFEELIQAFAQMGMERSRSTLILVTKPVPSLQKLIVELGLESHVQITGVLQRSELQQWMSWADLFALPSWNESFGLVYLEAMACGTPVLMTESCGLADRLESSTQRLGWVVPPEDVPALSRILGEALADTEALRLMGRQARNYVAGEYSWARNAGVISHCLWGRRLGDVGSQADTQYKGGYG